jgi:hypothetical protein
MSLEQPAGVQEIVALLGKDPRREIYELAGPPGRFTISHREGCEMPVFSREIAMEVAATGIVYQEPTCAGWFRRAKEASEGQDAGTDYVKAVGKETSNA